MNPITLLATIALECLSARQLPREPEPDLVMEDPEQVAAYNEAGRIDGLMAAAYLFHSARVSQVIQGCSEVLDLGCGPAIQLCQIAGLNPNIQFHGIDLSPSMLALARENIASQGLTNVRLSLADITKLDFVGTGSVDGVISTMALHHLPTQKLLSEAMREAHRVLKSGGALYLVDFGRLKRLKSVIYFAYQNAGHQPHLFTLDYERSLRAAFELDDFKRTAATELPGRATVFSTGFVPMLMVVKTEDRVLGTALRSRLKSLATSMPKRYRSDLNDIRIFFRLGGLANDPFA